MARMGHASISENGTVNGQRGDQTGREVCIRDWYKGPSSGWSFLAVHPDPAVREKHARAIEQACANNKIGYSQNDRNSLYAQAKAHGFDLSAVDLCNCDCSSLQNVAAVASGSGATYGANGWCTFNMESNLRKFGYKITTDAKFLSSADYSIRGGIYVNSSIHTTAGLDDGPRAAELLKSLGIVNAGVTAKPGPVAAIPIPDKLEITPFPPEDELRGAWKTTAPLNLRLGAGTSKKILTVIPEGATVRCYGYYNKTNGTRWPCVQYSDGATTWTGYCSEKYLTR